MDFTTGFYQPDIMAHYETKQISTEILNRSTFWETNKGNYRLFYQHTGHSDIVIGDEKQEIGNGTLVIASPNDLLLRKPAKIGENEFLFISVLPSVFSAFNSDKNFLRAFYYDDNKKKIINPFIFSDSCCHALLENFKYCLINHGERIHVGSRIFAIVSELDFEFDKQEHEKNKILKTDNLSANLIEYLLNHYTEKITLENLEKLFFVSSTTLNRLCKNAMKLTVLEFVQIKRLNLANDIIKNNKNISFLKVSHLCGFQDYSVFFKAYKKRYGKSPKEFRDNL